MTLTARCTKTLWNSLPVFLQWVISSTYSRVYNFSFTKYGIKSFCFFNNLNNAYLEQFISATTNSNNYVSFQDFFTRKLKVPLLTTALAVFPCEGYVCESDLVENISISEIKNEHRSINTIFFGAETAKVIPPNYSYINIFLHNHNYHRIHAPVTGTISRIQRINGHLTLLRPWFYTRDSVSLPALKNERVNIDIVDQNNQTWYLSIVGGMAVGTIELAPNIALGSTVKIGQELSLFKLGSTLCMASPYKIRGTHYLEFVRTGDDLLG